ncbi:MAG: transcriptional repressor LexA [Oscillospiraceae bacterium]|nr:transcriptional repressor LexA [Oscillospiraceae bacterium]
MLKQKDIQIYEYIKKRIGEGVSPSIREIQTEMGFRSTSSAFCHVQNLIEAGLIEKNGSLNRSLHLPNYNTITVPIMGTVTAGNPITAYQDIAGYVSFDSGKQYENPLFALRVRGDSMINAGILDGDIVVVEQCNYAENGDIVVALVNQEQEATVKRFYKEEGHYRLQPENDNMPPIIVENVEIAGKVVGLKRYY